MLHQFIQTWFHWVESWGYLGVFLLMAMESSIIPVPSEVVMPPAAFWAAQGRVSFTGVVLAGTLGSYFGSLISYLVSKWLGQPILRKYGKYVLLPVDRQVLAEEWVKRFGVFGVFVARLLPVIRHLISIPAGLFQMNLWSFSAVTLAGAGLWCTILSWLGQQIIGGNPELLDSPEAMVSVIKAKMLWIVATVLGLGCLYVSVVLFKKKSTLFHSNSPRGRADQHT